MSRHSGLAARLRRRVVGSWTPCMVVVPWVVRMWSGGRTRSVFNGCPLVYAVPFGVRFSMRLPVIPGLHGSVLFTLRAMSAINLDVTAVRSGTTQTPHTSTRHRRNTTYTEVIIRYSNNRASPSPRTDRSELGTTERRDGGPGSEPSGGW